MDIEASQILLNQGLSFLVISGSLCVIVVMGFLTKLLYDLSKLSQSANKTAIMLNDELKPTIVELNKTLKSFNEIVQNTGEGMGNMKLGLENVFSKTKLLSENVFGGFLKGFMTVYSLFCKKK